MLLKFREFSSSTQKICLKMLGNLLPVVENMTTFLIYVQLKRKKECKVFSDSEEMQVLVEVFQSCVCSSDVSHHFFL